MNTPEELLRHLTRPEVTELALMAGRLPCVRVRDDYQPVSEEAMGTGALVRMLGVLGGSRHVEALGPHPTQWKWRVPGLGVVGIVAQMQGETLRVRCALLQAEGQAVADATPGGGASAAPRPLARRAPAALGQGPQPSRPSRPTLPPPTSPPAPAESPTPAPDVALGAAPEIPFGDEDSASWQVPLPPLGPRAAALQTPAREAIPAPAREAIPAPLREAIPAPAREAIPAPLREAIPAPVHVPASAAAREATAALVGVPAAAAREATPAPVGLPSAAAREAKPAPTRALAGAAGPSGGADPGDGLDPVAVQLIETARSLRASDLHLIADRPPLMRIAGELMPQEDALPADRVERIALAMIPSRLRAAFERDGSCDFALDTERTGRLRVNASRQRSGTKICLRLIAREVPTLASLGLPDGILRATRHHQGLIVITGPSGHGKTSTLAAIVDHINSQTSHHVITVEDPVEYVHPRKMAMISQREVGTHTRTFTAALKGSLREDPDVIVVGELRDTETVRMALSASETGHLLIGTMNTPSAAKTIDRLIDLFPPADQAQVRTTLAGSLRLVVGQRLVPSVDRSALCVAAELLPGSLPLGSLIRDNRTFQIPSLQQRGRALGIVRLDESLAELVRSGRASLEAALVHAESPDELAALVTGVHKEPEADLGRTRGPAPAGKPVPAGGGGGPA